MEEELKIIRPKFLKPVKAENEEEARKRAKVGNTNISRFFVHLYSTLYGGKIKKDPWGNGLSSHTPFVFSPDIVREETENTIYTEVKATATNTSMIQCSGKQISNNIYETLNDIEEGKQSRLEYAFFKYGTRRLTKGVNLLSNSGLVNSLVNSKKELVVFPLNLFLYVCSFAAISERDQSSSQYNVDNVTYFNTRGSTLTRLLNQSDIKDLNDDRYTPEILKEFCLDDLKSERSTTPPVRLKYRTDFIIAPFPVTKWSIPEDKYSRFAEFLCENHKEISLSLGIRDLSEEAKNIPF
jgi:hypothetical protein